MLEECRICLIRLKEECFNEFRILFYRVEGKKRCIEVSFRFPKVINGIGETVLWREDRVICFSHLLLLICTDDCCCLFLFE